MGASSNHLRRIRPDFKIGRVPALNIQQFISSTMGDHSLQLEVIALFQAQLNKVVARDTEAEAKFLAHTLRGAALAIGAEEIAAIAKLWDDEALSPLQADSALRSAGQRFQTAVCRLFEKS